MKAYSTLCADIISLYKYKGLIIMNKNYTFFAIIALLVSTVSVSYAQVSGSAVINKEEVALVVAALKTVKSVDGQEVTEEETQELEVILEEIVE